MKQIFFIFALMLTALSAMAARQHIVLNLPTMNCPMCPITVKKALNKIDGVASVEINYQKKEAVITFDDEKTSIASLIDATTNAGFPASVRE